MASASGILDWLYAFFREVSGVALVTGGLSFLILPQRDFVNRRLGILLLGGGFLFSLSAFDQAGRVPVDLGNLLILAALLAISQSLADIVVYLFLDEAPPFVGRFYRYGIGWSLVVWLVPFGDYLAGREFLLRSVEDGALLPPLHAYAAYIMYAWPLVVVLALIPICRVDLRTIDLRRSGATFFGFGGMVLIAALSCALLGGLFGSRALYRVGHSLLQAIMLIWYFSALAKPALFSKARAAIKEEREHLLLDDPREAALIEARVAKAMADPAVIGRVDLDLRGLAAILHVQPYRLSIWFNGHQGSSFPAWLNGIRIGRARELLRARPDLSVLEVSLEVGYASKSAFNAQFRRLVGMSPSQWREGQGGGERAE